MTRLTLALCLLCLVQARAQQPYTVETIPNVRLENNSRVSNPDGILGQGAVATINSLLIDLEDSTTVQVAVVAVTSIGDADIFDFAQELFNTWGIGHENNNGVLVLLVTDQRTIRIHTGSGIEGVLTDVTCKRIERDYMVPSFKDGDYEGGMVAGIQRLYEVVVDPSSAEELTYDDEGNSISDYAALMIFFTMFYGVPFLVVWGFKANEGLFANSKKPHRENYKAMRLTMGAWAVEFGLIPLLILVTYWPGPPDDAPGWAMLTLYLYFMGTLVHLLVRERRMLKQFVEQGNYHEAAQFVGSTTWFWLLMALIFPLPFILYFLFHLTRKSHYRNHPRNCELCQAGMKKLSEREDDQYLDAQQQFEEKISALDYDVWLCPSCNATRAWHFVKRGKYKQCPKCKTQAYYSKSRRTVVSATYESSGQGKETFECKYCGETAASTYTIPRRVRSSSSSGSGSSGSSWGGGRSSGGGASSRW
jgi:uncharacterized protein